jgi:hypothetical protein
MKPEQIPSQDGQSEPQIYQQLDIDFKKAEKEAAVLVRAKELRDEHGWTEPYAISVARIEFKQKEWEERSGQKKKSN